MPLARPPANSARRQSSTVSKLSVTPLNTKAAQGAPKPKAGFNKGEFYRQCRMLHAYFSAFAFLALIFFSITGVMLNHADWFEGLSPAETTTEATVPAAALAQAKAAPDPAKALAEAVAIQVPVNGAFSSGDIMGDQALLRFDGPKGTTDAEVDLTTGKANLRGTAAPLLLMIQDLHRGKNSGEAWRWVLDLSAYLILALSLIGYILFFSLRFRLRISLILTGVSLIAMIGIVALFVP